MAFDPNKPFEVIEDGVSGFDPNLPFQEVTEETGTSFSKEVGQLDSAFFESLGRPLENMGDSFDVLGYKGVANALKGAITEPENYESAASRFIEPKPEDTQFLGFAWQYAPRAIVEQAGQAVGSLATRIAGAGAGAAAGSVAGPKGAAVGGVAGAFLGPAIFEAAQIIGPIAKERAQNNGREVPTNEDIIGGTMTAIGSGALNAIGARYLPGGEKATGKFFKRLASSFVGEGVTETGQAFVEQTGSTAGTEEGLNINVKQAIGEGLLGGGTAAGLTTITAPFSKPAENQVIRTPEQAEEIEIVSKANEEALNLMGQPADQAKNEAISTAKEIETFIANNEVLAQSLEPNDPEAKRLNLETKAAKTELNRIKNQIEQSAGLTPVESQQDISTRIENAKVEMAGIEPTSRKFKELETQISNDEAKLAALSEPIRQVETEQVRLAREIGAEPTVTTPAPEVAAEAVTPTPEADESFEKFNGVVQGFLKKEYPESEMGDDPLVAEMLRLGAITTEAEKTSDPKTWTKEERSAYDAGDYNTFSKLRGYTDSEIKDFNEYIRLVNEVREKYGDRVLEELSQPTISQFAYDTIFGEGTYDVKTEKILDFERPDISPTEQVEGQVTAQVEPEAITPIVSEEGAQVSEITPAPTISEKPQTSEMIGAEPTQPAQAPETAAQPAVVPERDVSKPEQMTPEEWTEQWQPKNVADAMSDPAWIGRNRDKWIEFFALANPSTYDEGRRLVVNPDGTYNIEEKIGKKWKKLFNDSSNLRDLMLRGGMPNTLKRAEILRVDAVNEGKSTFTERHRGDIKRALNDDQPVSFAAVETYGITLPEGYTKQGDLYVYQPTPAVSETITEPAAAPAQPTGIAVGNRIRLGRSPQTYTIEEVIPQTAAEQELGEQYYSVKNEKTGEKQVVEKGDLKPIGGRKRKMVETVAPVPEKDRHGQITISEIVKRFFGGKRPDRIYVVDDVVNPEYKYKAAYYPDLGIVVINNAFIRKDENIEDIIAHELGHYAFGDKKFKEAFDNFYNAFSKEEQAEIDKLMGDSYKESSAESQIEERKVIAFTSLAMSTPERRTLWNAVLDALKSFANRFLGKNYMMSDPNRTALAMLSTARRRFAAGEDITREDTKAKRAAAQTQDARFAELEARAKAGDKEAEAEAQRMVDAEVRSADKTAIRSISNDEGNKSDFPTDVPEDDVRWLKLFNKGTTIYFEELNSGNISVIEIKTDEPFRKMGHATKAIQSLLQYADGRPISFGTFTQQGEQYLKPLIKRITNGKISEGNDFTGVYRLANENQSVEGLGATPAIISADPFTYDDAGNLIPLSERFQTTTPDIRMMAAEMPQPRRSEDVTSEIDKAKKIDSVIKETLSTLDANVARDYNAFVNEGKSEKQIAEENKTSINSVRVNIVKGKKAVGDAIKKAKIDTNAKPDNGVIGWTIGAVKKYFTKEGELPGGTFQNWVRRNARLSKEAEEVRQATQSFYDGLRKIYKINRIKFILDGFSSIPPEDVAMFNDALAGEIPITSLPKEVQKPITRMRQHIDALSSELVATGQLPDVLEIKLFNNLGTYLTRSYKIFSDPKWVNKIPQEKLTAARNFLFQQAQKERNSKLDKYTTKLEKAREDGDQNKIQNYENLIDKLNNNPYYTIEAADRKLEQMLNDWSGEKDTAGKRGGRLGAKDLSVMMTRSDVPKQLRDVMGENTNIIFNYANTVGKISRFIADQNFLDAVKSEGAGKFLFTKDSAPKGFNTQIAPEESRTMSPLSGLRTSPEIAKAFEEFGKAYDSTQNPFLHTLAWLNAVGKANLTVGSVLTQMRNLIGQPFFFLSNGHTNLGVINDEVNRLMKDQKLSKKEAREELVKMAAGEGLVGENAYAGELKEAFEQVGLKTFEDMDADDFSKQFVLFRLFRSGTQGAQRIYQKTDEFGKIIGWLNETDRVMRMNEGISREDAMSIASERVRNTYPTYSQGSQALRLFRRQPFIGPFATFFYETFRTTYWNVKYAFDDINKGGVALKEGIARLAGTMAQLSIGAFLANAVSKMVSGITDEEEEDVRRMLPPWEKDAAMIWFPKDKQGVYNYINLSYVSPYNALTDPFVAMLSGFARGENPLTVLTEATGSFLEPFVSEQPVTAAITDVMRNKTETGKKVYNEEADLSTQTTDVLLHVFGKAFTPGTIDRIRRRIVPAIYGETVGTRAPEPVKEIASELTGIRFQNLDMKQAFQNRAWEFNKSQNESERIFRDVATRRRRVTAEEQIEAYRVAEQSRFENWQEMYRDYMAVRRAGATEDEAIELMNDIRISKREASLIAGGEYMPYEVSKEVIRRSELNGNEVPLDEIDAIAESMPIVLQDLPKNP